MCFKVKQGDDLPLFFLQANSIFRKNERDCFYLSRLFLFRFKNFDEIFSFFNVIATIASIVGLFLFEQFEFRCFFFRQWKQVLFLWSELKWWFFRLIFLKRKDVIGWALLFSKCEIDTRFSKDLFLFDPFLNLKWIWKSSIL